MYLYIIIDSVDWCGWKSNVHDILKLNLYWLEIESSAEKCHCIWLFQLIIINFKLAVIISLIAVNNTYERCHFYLDSLVPNMLNNAS